MNVVNIEIPPLRERRSDVVALAEHFSKKYAQLNGVPDKPFSNEARAAIAGAAWPGNVRELENAIHRAVLLSTGEAIEKDAVRLSEATGLTAKPRDADPDQSFVGQTVAQVEQELIIRTLDHCLGNRTHAATILGISIRTLRNKLKQYTEDGVAVPPPGVDRASA